VNMKSPFLIFRSTKHQGDFLSSSDPSMISWIHFTLFVRISLFSYRETETDLINRISIMNRGSLRKSYMQPMQPTPCNPQFSHRAGILACKVMFTVILFIAVMFYLLPGTVENISLKEAFIENISVDNHPTGNIASLSTGEGKDLDENIVNTISNLCSLSNLKSNIGKYQCSSVCNDHLCCVMDGRSNCTKGNEAICSKYSLCSNLFTSHSASTTCTVDNVKNKEGWIKCYERCASGMCCFNGRECPEDLDCTLYEDCTVLDVDENPVASVCTQENMIMLKAKNECKSYCDSKMCCLEDGGKNCPESVMDCEKYTPCAILL